MAEIEGTTEEYHDAQTERALDLYIKHLDRHINRGIFILYSKANEKTDEDKYRCASLMLLNAGISLLNVKKFYNPITLHSKDVVVLYRIIYESILNALFVLASPNQVAEKAFRHAKQKGYRSHGKSFDLGPYKAEIQMKGFPKEIENEIQEFTSKKGRELNWTQLTIRERIGVVAEKYGPKIWLSLGSSYEGYYSVSSEHVHGSLYGVLEFMGHKNKENFFSNMERTIWTVLIESGCAVLALLDALEVETGIDTFKDASEELRKIILIACEMQDSEQS